MPRSAPCPEQERIRRVMKHVVWDYDVDPFQLYEVVLSSRGSVGHSEEYFTKKLHPLQDGILDIVKRSGTPFYLTGGTALSRGRYGHRYSEDLDLFVDNDSSYSVHVDTL